MKKVNLFCLPFAGGNKYSYREFIQHAPGFVTLIGIEYPGRGSKFNEPMLEDMDTLVDNLYNELRLQVDNNDYAIYGHSMGGLVAFLLARKLIENNHRLPLHLFVTGTMGPSSARRYNKQKHLLGKKEFIDEIRKLEGCPDEILDNEDLLDFYEPILRSDFKVTETFLYNEKVPFNIPLTVVTGTEEEMEQSDIRLWQNETTYQVDFRKMDGKHFFIFQYPNAIMNLIGHKLLLTTNKTVYE